MLKKVFIIFFLLFLYSSTCFAVIAYSKYDSLILYYGNNLDKTPLNMLERYKSHGVTYQEFFYYWIVFSDFNLFYTNMKCEKDRNNTDCLRIIAKMEVVADELPLFAEYNGHALNVSIFEQWKENAMQGKPTFDLSEKGKDWKYITIVLNKVEDINTHTK